MSRAFVTSCAIRPKVSVPPRLTSSCSLFMGEGFDQVWYNRARLGNVLERSVWTP